ncbi:hypothetical protein HK101_011888 [Irineochytrium annulatum]|nr:hypothetical protein HK101_011888 [Irineochytrium annulatum]
MPWLFHRLGITLHGHQGHGPPPGSPSLSASSPAAGLKDAIHSRHTHHPASAAAAALSSQLQASDSPSIAHGIITTRLDESHNLLTPRASVAEAKAHAAALLARHLGGGGAGGGGGIHVNTGGSGTGGIATPSSGGSPTRAKKDVLALKNEIGPKLIIVMVGLPARGKSYICKKLCRYLSWCGFNTRVFNVGNRRRVMGGEGQAEGGVSPDAGKGGGGNTTSFTGANTNLKPGHISLMADPSSATSSPGLPPFNLPEPILPTSTATSPRDSRQFADQERPVLKVNGEAAENADNNIGGRSPSHRDLLKPALLAANSHSPVVVSAAGTTQHDAKFFDPQNDEARAIRERLAMDTLDEAISWLRDDGGKVAIHDATNSTVERRRAILDRVARERNTQCVFIESICTRGAVLEQNILMKLQGPDYINVPREQAIEDFRARMRNYERAYETIGEEEEARDVSYIKLIDCGRKVTAHNVHGYISSQCVFYLMQIHIKERTIWLTRHGESTYNVFNRIGGDAPLTELGHRYAAALAKFIKSVHPPPTESPGASVASLSLLSEDDPERQRRHREELSVWTSTLERTLQSVEGFIGEGYEMKHFKNLNEISAGNYEDMTYEEIERDHPIVWAERASNKLLFRYPGTGGESYSDVIERLRPIIVELERMESNVLIVSHHVTMRTLLAYFCGLPLEEMTTLNVPLHTLYRLRPMPYGAEVIKYEWNPTTDEFEEIGGTL